MTLGSFRSQGVPTESTTPVNSTCQNCPNKIIKIFSD
jgi:hypothetical protein